MLPLPPVLGVLVLGVVLPVPEPLEVPEVEPPPVIPVLVPEIGVLEVPEVPETVVPVPLFLVTCCINGSFRVLKTSLHMPELEVGELLVPETV